MDKRERSNWLEEAALDITSCHQEGKPSEIVKAWENESWNHNLLPEWFDYYSRQYLVRTVAKYQVNEVIEHLLDKCYSQNTGYQTRVIIEPGGKTPEGLDYAPREIEVVVLDTDGDVVAYRYMDAGVNEAWLVGTPEDVGDYWLIFLDDDEE